MKAICKDINENSYIIESNGEIFELPIYIYKKYGIQKGKEFDGKIIEQKNTRRRFFEPNHPIYSVGDIIDLPITKYVEQNNKAYYIVSDHFENDIKVCAFDWQNKTIGNNNLHCEVVNIKSGKPMLRNIDYVHPIYEIGKTYEFDFVEIAHIKCTDGRSIDLIQLRGSDGKVYETSLLPGQSGYKFNPRKIKCEVVNIEKRLKLKQVEVTDPYFSKFEEIIKGDSQTAKKYFYDLRDNDGYKDLFNQYDSQRSLWVITYCNKILPDLITQYAVNLNLKEAIALIDILLVMEKWILKNGLVDSFKKDITKKEIKIKSERFIEKFQIMKSTFIFIGENNIDISSFKTSSEKALGLIYYLRFNKHELINYPKLFRCFIELIKQNKIDPIGKYEITNLTKNIEIQKNDIRNNEIETNFAIGNHDRSLFNCKEDLILYLKYTIIQVYINESTNKSNIYLAEYYQHLSFYYQTDLDKKNSLKRAYQLIRKDDAHISFDINHLNFLNKIEYISDSFSSMCELQDTIDKKKWSEIVKDSKGGNVITVCLKQKTPYGYIGYYNDMYCILPKSNIKSSTLKVYNQTECDILINVIIRYTYYNFGTIIIDELPLNNTEHKLDNLLKKELKRGDVVNAKVKKFVDHGLILSCFAGDGLLCVQDITNLDIDGIQLETIFDIGEEFEVYVISNLENKLKFGTKRLHGTKHEETLKEIESRILSPMIEPRILSSTNQNHDDNYLNKQIYIQGHLLEYFSNLQYDFEGKIKYLEFSKVFYSALLLSRSYFLNAYISYFEILNHIEESLENKSKNSLTDFIEKASTLHMQLKRNTKSIEKFPSIQRLISFLDILRQYNDTSNDSINNLTDYILKQRCNDNPILSKVAKVVLSNNLIVSEKDDADFVFKNLRILYQYLKDGIFDIAENESERKERELKERISHIRNNILNKESENVEFKSSLLSPILDPTKSKKLAELEIKNDCKSKSEIDKLTGKIAKNRVIHSAMKTLVAFANSKGGTLYIGVNDEGEFIGLCEDYKEIGEINRDKLGQKFDEIINTYIGNSFYGRISTKIEAIDMKEILIVDVKPSSEEVFLLKNGEGEKCCDFYIRRHSSSVKLEGPELLKYCRNRHSEVV